MNDKAKILLTDIETSPSKSYLWGLWQEIRSMDFITKDWYILCFSAKWLGKKEMISESLPESKSYKKNPECDKEIMLKMWDLLDEASIVVAHNGKKFDIKKINARFIYHGLTPPSPYKVVDTLLEARRHFAFTSNRLGDIGQFLKVGKKMNTGGFQLWKDCLNGDEKAWRKMVKYCQRDVRLLEKIYLKLRPYMKQHPNLGIFLDKDRPCCPKCGSNNIQYRGYAVTNVSKFRRFQCQKCGGWGRERMNILEKEQSKALATNIS